MQEHALDPDVYIRSMASRGHLGGLSWSTPQALRVLDAAGCDVVLVETVGVGQSEVEVAGLADTTVVLLAPGMGDAIQAAKAGILEVGDVYVVNKADRDGADATVRELRHMLTLGERRQAGDWRPPIVKTVASRGEGIDELVEALAKHRSWLEESGELRRRRQRRAADEVEAIAVTALRSRMGDLRSVHGAVGLDDLAAEVVGRPHRPLRRGRPARRGTHRLNAAPPVPATGVEVLATRPSLAVPAARSRSGSVGGDSRSSCPVGERRRGRGRLGRHRLSDAGEA